MGAISYDLRLDAARMGSQAAVTVKRGDSRSRVLRVRLYAGSTPVPLPAGALAVLRGIKPDGHIFLADCTVAGNLIEQVITAQMMAVSGAVACELTVYDPEGMVLSTPSFDLYVEDLLIGDGVIESTDEYTALTEAMLRLATIEQAEIARDEAEQERVAGEAEREALYDEVKERYESGGFNGEAGTVEIAQTQTAEPGEAAAFIERPESTQAHRRYTAVIPTGPKGETGNLVYATFGVDFDAGEAVMYVPEGYDGPDFNLNGETCNLEVLLKSGGTPLPLGRIVPMPAGNFSAAVDYPFLAIVYHEGDAYLARKPTRGNLPTDADYWMRVTHVGEGTTVRIGQVLTGAPGTAAAVVNVGTALEQVWDITIPRGQDGTGQGDMAKAVYDQSGNGVVDDAERLGGVLPGAYALKTDVPNDILRYNTAQTLTAQQQASVRTKIGAGTSSFDGAYGSLSGAPLDILRYDTAQTLTTAQQVAVREKIGAGSGGFDGDYLSLTNKPTIPSAAADIGAVPVTRKVAGKALSADITLSKADVGLSNVDNTSDANKPVSTATQTALNGKSDAGHTHSQYITIDGGSLVGTLEVGNASVGSSRARNIYAGTADMVAGSTALLTGSIYLVYE